MNILITGGSGFVGSHMARRLVSMPGAKVTLWLRPTSNLWRIHDIKDKLSIEHVDLKDADAVRDAAQALRPDVIYHFANAGVYGGVSASPVELTAINVGGLKHLIDGLEDIPFTSFINVGSSSEYGLKNAPMKEGDECNPQNAYGVSKLAATRIASEEARLKELPIATYRLFSPFGPYDDASRLIMQTMRACLHKTPMTLPHPASVRDYNYIDDVIDLLFEAMQLKASGEVFNVGYGVETKALDFAYQIADVMNARDFLDTCSRTETLGPSESPRWQADTTKLFSTLKWRPRYTVQEGIAKTVEWYKANESLYKPTK